MRALRPVFALPRYNRFTTTFFFLYTGTSSANFFATAPLTLSSSSPLLPFPSYPTIHRVSFCSEPLSQVTEAAFQEAETDLSGFGKLLLVAHLNAEEEQDAAGFSLLPFPSSTKNAVVPVAKATEKEEKEMVLPPETTGSRAEDAPKKAAVAVVAPPIVAADVAVQPAAAPPPCATTTQTRLSFKKRKKSNDSCAGDSSCTKKNRQLSPTTPSSALTATATTTLTVTEGRPIAVTSLEPPTSMATPRGVEAALVIDTIAQRVADRCVSSRVLRSPLIPFLPIYRNPQPPHSSLSNHYLWYQYSYSTRTMSKKTVVHVFRSFHD